MDRDTKPADLTARQPGAYPEVTVVENPNLVRSDRKFFIKAAKSGTEEMYLSQQAATRATHAQVREYASRLVSAHDTLNRELVVLAARKGVGLAPYHDTTPYQPTLANKSAGDYDEAYLEHMIDAHEDAIDLFDKASKSKDVDIAAFAVQYLPALRDHLATAERLEKAVD